LAGHKLKIVSVKTQQTSIGDPVWALPMASSDEYMNIAIERYPSLFSKDTNALPVTVTLRDESYSNSYVVLMYVTAFLSLGTLPCYPVEGTVQINAELVFSDHDFHEFCVNSVRFERMNRTWISVYTPLGLIPVPGNSDLPRVSGVGASRSTDAIESSRKLTMISTIDAIVQGARNCGVQAFEKRR
jgi:hypothetical protein